MSEHSQAEAVVEDLTRRGAACLRRIAGALGCPVDDLFGGLRTRSDLGGAAELLVLWGAISNEADRARLLAYAREVASDSELPAAAG